MQTKTKRRFKAAAKVATLFLLATLLTGALVNSTLASRETHYSLHSSALNGRRSYSVIVPRSYARSPHQRYPVLYVLDGERTRNNRIAAGIADLLSLGSNVPEMIIVSVHGNGKRTHDYMPIAAISAYNGTTTVGGAATFTTYLTTELVPHIETHFRSDGFRILSGHSLAGLFVVDHFTKQAGIFQAFFAYSPTFTHDKSSLDRIRTHTKSPAKNNSFLFMNIGYESPLYTEYFNTAQLTFQRGQRQKSAPIVTEYHTGILHPFIMMTGEFQALRSLYRGTRLPDARDNFKADAK